MPFEIRPCEDEAEVRALHELLGAAFGGPPTDEEHADEVVWFEADRSLAVVEDGAFVGAAGAYSFDLTLPGGAAIPVAGVTWVGVLPTHRRRGILTAMMDRQLDDVAARGEAVAILTASEGSIYGRFGYGMASEWAQLEIDTRRTAFRAPPAAAPGGRLRLLSKDEAPKVLPGLYDAYRRAQPGAVSRSDRYWEKYFRDRESWRDGASSRFYVVHESAEGVADGYSGYRVKQTWSDTMPGNTSIVLDVVTTDPEVEAALWRYLFDLDLVTVCKAWNRPLDDPLRHRLVDPRVYNVTRTNDWLWVRVLDVPAALAARRYGTDDALVLDLHDPFRPANDGQYRVQNGSCQRVDGVAADLALGAEDLGVIYLGGTRPSVLARAGRVRELTPGALGRADALFASDRLPHCITGF